MLQNLSCQLQWHYCWFENCLTTVYIEQKCQLFNTQDVILHLLKLLWLIKIFSSLIIFEPEFTVVIFIHYKLRIAVTTVLARIGLTGCVKF